MEKGLGVALFDRSTTPIRLTSAGHRFCSYANDILELENKLRQELRAAVPSLGKPIRIGVPLLAGEYILSRILPRMLNQYPHVQIDPVQDLSDNLCQQLRSYQLDAVFICSPIQNPKFCSEILCYENIFLVGHRNHPALKHYDTLHASLEHPLVVDLSQLRGVPLIHSKPIAILSYRTEEFLKQAHFQPQSEIKVSSLPLALDLATQGMGFTGVMQCQLKYENPNTTSNLCPIQLDGCQLPFYLAYNRSSRDTLPELDLFVQEVLEAYRKTPCI